jgi:hypothetical protein
MWIIFRLFNIHAVPLTLDYISSFLVKGTVKPALKHSVFQCSLYHYKEKNTFLRGMFGFFLVMYVIQHCFICRSTDSTVSEDAGIEHRTVAAWHWQSDSARSHSHSAIERLILTVNESVVYMASYVMVLRRATSLRGALEGVGPGNRDFFGPSHRIHYLV